MYLFCTVSEIILNSGKDLLTKCNHLNSAQLFDSDFRGLEVGYIAAYDKTPWE